MRWRAHIGGLALAAALGLAGAVQAAQVTLRDPSGGAPTAAVIGDTLSLELVVDAGLEEITGLSLFLSYDRSVFQLLAAGEEGGAVVPFEPGPFLQGIVLVNRAEEVGDEVFLAYVEASGVQRRVASGEGVAARCQLVVIRRPAGDLTTLAVEERGHDRSSHYLTADAPGEERGFAPPLGSLALRITGFRILPLPDLEIVAGEPDTVLRLDDYVDQSAAVVLWSVSVVDQLGVAIDDSNRVILDPRGFVGDTTLTFTALELTEGNQDEATIHVRVRSRPVISGLPAAVTFAEDGVSAPLTLGSLATDADDGAAVLRWAVSGGRFVTATIDTLQGRLTFTAAPNAFGTDTLALVVTDPGGLRATDSLRVVVTPVNDPPRILRHDVIYPVLGDADLALPLDQLVEDVDDSLATLQLLFPTEGGITAELSSDGRSLLVRGTAVGRGILRLTVQDPAGARDTGRQVAMVLEPGGSAGPEIGRLPALRFYAGSAGTLGLEGLVRDDRPFAELTWQVQADSGLRNPVVTGGTLAVAAAPAFTGETGLRLTAIDQQGNRDTAVLPVEVLDVAQGARPRVVAPAKIGLVGGAGADTLNLDEMVDDPDDRADRMAWKATVSQDLSAVLFAGSRVLTLAAPEGVRGLRSLTLSVADPSGRADTATVPVLVAEPTGPPALGQPVQVVLDSVGAEGRVDLDDVAFDADDDESELLWSVLAESGVETDLDPVSHLLRVRRVEDGRQPAPLTSRVILTVVDTDGEEASVVLEVALPPVFELSPIPDVAFYTGTVDTSLALDRYVVAGAVPTLVWSVAAPQNLTARIDTVTHRVRLEARRADFVGSEILRFTALDVTGRSRTAPVRVTVRSRGLAPQVRDFPELQVLAGQEDSSIDLDQYVVDDDPDSVLGWTATQPAGLTVGVDAFSHLLTVRAQPLTSGPRQIQLVVRDPAGNTAAGLVDVVVRLGGQPPVIASLPQLILGAGAPERALSLDPYVDDADTPAEQIAWDVSAEPGVAARVDGRRLYLSVPPGGEGALRLVLTATDPEGNRDEAQLTVLVQADDKPPAFAVRLERHPAAAELLRVVVTPDEALSGPPEVRLAGEPAELEETADSSYVAPYLVPSAAGEQRLAVAVRGTDRAGNEGTMSATIALRWMDAMGGSLLSPDGLVALNVPDAASGPGELASVYELTGSEVPGGADGNPAYAVGLSGTGQASHPSTLNLFAGSRADEGAGILRWDPATRSWEELPTAVDEESGWVSATVDQAGIYRLGQVGEANRRMAEKLANHPNPFPTAHSSETSIEYILASPGPVRLEVTNCLGQRVRLLVDEAYQEVGTWSVLWDGRDDAGRPLASGVYFYQLVEGGARRARSLALVR
ncbi:MAG: Ig-like domain-containing protein [Gemmatimonadota bacterium]